MKALLDTCIIIDALQGREPFFDDAQNLIIAEANGEYDGFITAKSVLDIYYIVHRHLHSDEKTRLHISKLTRLFHICDTTAEDTENALFSDLHDYEDAVMVETAKRVGMDAIITRNLGDYEKAGITVMSPADYLMMIDKKKGETD